jgi:hypothetical protein
MTGAFKKAQELTQALERHRLHLPRHLVPGSGLHRVGLNNAHDALDDVRRGRAERAALADAGERTVRPMSMKETIELLQRQRVGLSDVVADLPEYHVASTKVPCSWDDKGKVMRLLSQQFNDRRTKQIDGVKIDLGEEWVLVLPDVDRPIFHILAESDTGEGARVLMDKYAALVSSLQR